MSSECLFWAVKTKVGNAQRKLILIALADIANEKKQCWPSHEYLAQVAECSRSSVIRQLKELESAGLITTTQRTEKNLKKSNIYTLHPDVSERHIDVSERHRGSVTVTHNTLIDTPIKHICSNWLDWVSHRKQMKKPLTKLAMERQIKFLEGFDEQTRVKIIEQSIFKGWAGLFELKGEHDEINQRSNTKYRPGTAAAAAAKLRERIKSNS